jgi:uncharacterized protein
MQAPKDPTARALLSQRWSDNTFLHWRTPVESVRAQVPRPLQLDTYGGESWLSLVALRVRQVRPGRLPGFLGASYSQVNLRTYVSHSGVQGVFFLGIHFSSALVAAGASLGFGIPARRARLRFAHMQSELSLQVDSPRDGSGGLFARLSIGDEAHNASEGQLDHWLHERYSFFSLRGRNLLRTDVTHAPWSLRPAQVLAIEGALGGAQSRFRVPEHATYAEHKDVVMAPSERVARLPRGPQEPSSREASL